MNIRVTLAAGGADWESSVVRALTGSDDGLTLVRRCVDVTDLVAVAATGQADVAVVSTGLRGLDADVVRRLLEAGVSCVAVGPGTDPAEVDRAARLGVRAVVPSAEADRLPEVLHSVHPPMETAAAAPAGEHPTQPPVERGRLVAVWGPTGAPGRSMVALGVAAETAALGRSTCLLDVDVYGGAIAPMLAMLDEVSGVLAAARLANTGTCDVPGLTSLLRSVSANLHVLTGFPRSDRWPQLRPGALAAVLDVARQVAGTVVVDCGFCIERDEELSFDTTAPRRNGATIQALESADTVLVVGAADPLGISRLARSVLDLHEVVPGQDVRILMNRVRPGLGWSVDEISDTVHRFTGRRPVAFLPEDVAARDRTAIRGQTLPEVAPTSRLRRELQRLATTLVPAEVPADRVRSRRAAAAR